MKIACTQFGVPNNNDHEMELLRHSIETVSADTNIDPRFVLAIVLQESAGCVRVPTTDSTHDNPGLMQSFAGAGSCNSDGRVQNPCPGTEIYQMVVDGTNGTLAGPGLVQDLSYQGMRGAMGYYRSARLYNSGSLPWDQNLSEGGSTSSYASDIANRLTGWAYAAHTFSA